MMALVSTGTTVIVSILVVKVYHKEDAAPPPFLLLWICRIQPPPDEKPNAIRNDSKSGNSTSPQTSVVDPTDRNVRLMLWSHKSATL